MQLGPSSFIIILSSLPFVPFSRLLSTISIKIEIIHVHLTDRIMRQKHFVFSPLLVLKPLDFSHQLCSVACVSFFSISKMSLLCHLILGGVLHVVEVNATRTFFYYTKGRCLIKGNVTKCIGTRLSVWVMTTKNILSSENIFFSCTCTCSKVSFSGIPCALTHSHLSTMLINSVFLLFV